MKEKENTNFDDIKERLNDYILYLKSNKLIKTNQDIVETGLVAKSNLSKAINGDPKYLTKSLVKKLTNHFNEAQRTFEDIWFGQGSVNIKTEILPTNDELDSVFNIKNRPHDEQMAILHKDILELKKENEELKDMVDDLTLKIEISLAPILRHFKLKADTKEKQKSSSSN